MRELRTELNKKTMDINDKIDMQDLKNKVKELQEKNEELQVELDITKEQLILSSVSSSLPNVYEGKHNSARIKFYKHLAKTMNVNEYATRHIFNEACDWYKTLS